MARFHKMHGLGNDFVVLDAREETIAITPERARAVADRRTGVGCDQVILVEPAPEGVSMRIWNADGGEVEACGNAARCVAALTGGGAIRTAGGVLDSEALGEGASVTLPPPRFEWDAIPLAYPTPTDELPVGWEVGGAWLDKPAAVNVGNPHLVFIQEGIEAEWLIEAGPTIENDPLFPERINVNVVTPYSGNVLALHTWERGAGLTRACGTGACATAVVGIRRGLVRSPVIVSMLGGELEIAWAPGEPILMTGPATHVFTGEIDLEAVVPANAGTSTEVRAQSHRDSRFRGNDGMANG